jgi:hypothetical protein
LSGNGAKQLPVLRGDSNTGRKIICDEGADFVSESLPTDSLASIGFGDIVAKAYYVKLMVALLGIIGQFYTVILFGIIISKFTSKENSK